MWRQIVINEWKQSAVRESGQDLGTEDKLLN